MRYFTYHFRQLILLMLPSIAAYVLVGRIGLAMTLAAIAAAAAVAVSIAGVLLHTSELGKVTWKNRVAGPLAPWGWRLANGKLMRSMVASGVIWLLLAVPGVLLAMRPTVGNVVDGESLAGPTMSIFNMVLLAIFWLINGAALLWILATLAKNFSLQSSSGKSLIKAVAFCLVLISASVLAFLMGYPILSTVIAGTPPTAIGLFFLLYLGIILVAGKNTRWN